MDGEQPIVIIRQVAAMPGAQDSRFAIMPAMDRVVVGRSEDADWCLNDPRTSRRHAAFRVLGSTVVLRDLGSRHGTAVNGVQLQSNEEFPIGPGDRIRFGAAECTVHGGGSVVSTPTIHDDPSHVSVVAPAQVGGLARARLSALIDASKRLVKAASRAQVAELLIDSVTALPECARAGVLRPIGEDDYELIAAAGGDSLTPSRSLLREAANGHLAQLSGENTVGNAAYSIVEMGVRSAVCVPVHVGTSVDSVLYVDTRGNERAIDADTIAFCDAAGAIAGLAIERVAAEESEARRQRVELDLRSARDAQRMLFPEHAGEAAGVSYVFESIPGRFVGGDLFDLFPIDEHRTAFFLGDAVGKGAGAGVLMVTVQTLLRNLLESGSELSDAMARTNASLALRSEADKFVTLLAGIWDAQAGTVELADAGHGLVLLDRGDGFQQTELNGNIPLGISTSTTYGIETLVIDTSSRLVAFSDGVTEQPDAAGEQFGVDRILGCLDHSSTSPDDVTRLIDAVRTHARADFSDDLTVASLTFAPASRQ